MAFFWISLGFVSGALPFSVWIGRLALHRDIRSIGDHNPGAMNVFRAGGKGWGWLAILLDGLKGAIPVGIAHFGYQLDSWGLVATALAPIAGHAFSPFLKFRGGKAIAVTYGIWAGLSLWLIPVILGTIYTILHRILKNDRLTILSGQAGLLVALPLVRADWTWYVVWLGSTIVYYIKHPNPKQLSE